MPAGKKNLVLEQGTDFSFSFTIKDPITKDPIDLTGYTFAGQIRENYDSPTPAETFHISVPTPANGTVVVELSNAETSAMESQKNMFYDIEGTTPGSKKFRILEGQIYISPEVTR